ncbi:MAG: preprotein translocase subunit SecA [archaeon]
MLKWIFGDKDEKLIKEYAKTVDEINALETGLVNLSDAQLKDKTEELKKELEGGAELKDVLVRGFALVREASRRTLGERHYDVQLIGGILLNDHKIAEMRTGEGKTLVATLPVYLNALTAKGVHVVTVNDYLARRDAVWMGQVYSLLGLSVSVINHDSSYIYDPAHKEADNERDQVGSYKIKYEFLRPCTRHDAYMADITYGTNSEFGFDYLRDNIEYEQKDLRQRELNYAVVDEIDSILIDEARTPLIISAPTVESEDLYIKFAGISRQFNRDEDFTVDEKLKAIQLTPEGIAKAERMLGVENIYTEMGIKYVHHLETAVRAKALYSLDKDYVVRDGEIVIVDEFTGRLQPGRRWSEGLHQAIEAKEGVDVQKESRTFASITYQNYFRMYKKLGGMTGTGKTSEEEFFKVYGLEVIAVPTHRPSARKDYNDLIFQTEIGKFKAIAKKVKELHSNGQPVLVGTVSIEKNELLSQFLTQQGVPHTVLNAKNHEKEGEIVANAGRKSAVTIATNMAGRGVDIKLGGVPFEKNKAEEVKETGGLFVLGTERHDARRIDNQLRGRAGRQGDPGATQFFVSLEDSLMRIFASDTVKKMMAKLNIPEDEPIENSFITRALENAQTKIEGFNFDARKHVLEYDNVLNHQRTSIYARRYKVLMGEKENLEAEYVEIMTYATDEESEIINAKRKEMGDEDFLSVLRRLILQSIDLFWVDHLELMDYLRGSVNLRAYGQRDPLIEYKRESLQLFKDLQVSIMDQVIKLIPHVVSNAFKQEEERMKTIVRQAEIVTSENKGSTLAKQIVNSANKIGRNDPCPCGSGKKWKKCGELNTEEHQRLMNK